MPSASLLALSAVPRSATGALPAVGRAMLSAVMRAPASLARGPVHARSLVSSSMFSRVLGARPSVFDTPFSLIPRLLEEDFARELRQLDRGFGAFVHVQVDDESKDMTVTFDGMGHFSNVDVSYDKDSGVLTVKGSEGEKGRTKTRAVIMPVNVAKPEMVEAETRDGCVVVKVPGAAQEDVPKQLKNEKLNVRLVGAGESDARGALDEDKPKKEQVDA